jgi:ATP-binding cassette subfamily B multidrug efflux pump
MAIQEEEVLGKAYDSRIMRRLFRYLRPYTFQVVLAVSAILLKAGCDVLGPLLTKTAIDKYLAHSTGAGPKFLNRMLSSDPVRGISQIAFMYLCLLVIGFLLDYTQTYMMQWTGQKVMFDLRSQLYRHVQRMHLAFFDRNPVGRLVTRLTTDVDALNEMFTSGVVSIFEDIFVLIGIVSVMLSVSWKETHSFKLALITFAVLPLIIIATNFFRRAVRDGYRRIRTAIARINSYLQEHVSGIVPLQLFNREEISYREFEAVNAQHMQAFKDTILAYALYYPIVETLSVVAIALVIWYGGHGVLSHAVQIGTLVAFIQYSQRFFRPIQDLSEKYNILQGAMASSERIFRLLDTPPAIVSAPEPKEPKGPGRIEFDQIWFAYRHVPLPEDPVTGKSPGPSDEWDWVLRDASFTIEPGQSVAIVGHTGAGKTTLISLLLRFYDVQKGAVRIDGVDVRDMDLQELRRRCGVVLQDPFLFSGTIADNIRLGTETVTVEDVERAANEVNIADFIESLPEKYETPVVERGSTLSTGQKQLISFARALAHKPSILILDEATSSVDTETEFRVREALTRLVEGRTSLIIAHRLSTIQRADKIIVMHKGKVREQGTHQELLAQRGIYYKLYQLQYKDQEVPAQAAPPTPTLSPLPQPAGD